MDFGSLISRAWNVTWRNRFLWLLGFLVGLAGVGSSFTNTVNMPGQTGSSGLPAPLEDFLESGRAAELERLIAPVIGLLVLLGCVGVLVGLVFWVVSVIAGGGLIAGVDQIERSGGSSFGAAWRVGVSKFWRLVGLSITLSLPAILTVIVFGCFALFGITASGVAIFGEGSSGGSRSAEGAFGALMLAVVCVAIVLACVLIIYGVIAGGIQVFGERAIVLHNQGVFDGIRAGWAMLRGNLGNTILIALLMFVISMVISLIVGVIAAALALPSVALMTAEAQRSSEMLTAGSLIVGVVTGLVIAVIAAAISALFTAFNSTTWTLAYRQFAEKQPGLTTQ